ncbi:MAG: hypothetical protein KGI67_00390 [Pseudomonadota bacterium]|nr:hypothetical protein [Pseudomonadota bacterium]
MDSTQTTAAPEVTRSLSAAWPGFAARLAKALAQLEEDQFLVIDLKHGSRYVQFAAQGAHGMRAETVSNGYLDKGERLDAGVERALVAAGWQAPTGSPGSSTPQADPDGSPNFFADFPAPVDVQAIADLAVRTLAVIFMVPHPGYLQYDAGEIRGPSLELPDLGLKRLHKDPAAASGPDPEQQLLATLKDMTGLPDLAYDRDGDIALSHGSVRGYVRLSGPLPHVRIFAFLVAAVAGSPELLARINEINAALGYLHLFWRNEAVVAITEVAAEPLVAAHVVWAVNEFFQIANGIDSLLQAEFGGTVSLPSVTAGATRH